MLTGIVLSGGESSRMGQNKGLVNLRGDPMVSYVINSMLSLVDEVVISVAKGQSEKYDEYAEIGFEIVEDRTGGIGPVEGIVSGLNAARGDYVLVSPCDTPFLKPSVCELLLAKADGHDGAAPVINNKYEPLHGAFKKETATGAFAAILSEKLRKPSAAYKRLDMTFVDEASIRKIDPDLESFWNVNTPEDLRQAEKRIIETSEAEGE